MTKIFLILCIFFLTSCDNVEDSEEYKQGYSVGYADGADEKRDELCGNIESRIDRNAAIEAGC
jgi:uncharacterized protein YceK